MDNKENLTGRNSSQVNSSGVSIALQARSVNRENDILRLIKFWDSGGYFEKIYRIFGTEIVVAHGSFFEF